MKCSLCYLKDSPENAKRRFSTLRMLESMDEVPKIENYEIQLSFEVENLNLEDIFCYFNGSEVLKELDLRTMSVSDVIVVDEGPNKVACYCDSIGFKELSEKFFEG